MNPQIKYIYQRDKTIEIYYDKVFATLSTPIDIATDIEGNVHVLNGGSNRVLKFTINGIFVKEWNINNTLSKDH